MLTEEEELSLDYINCAAVAEVFKYWFPRRLPLPVAFLGYFLEGLVN
jgi:hypothetical protein